MTKDEHLIKWETHKHGQMDSSSDYFNSLVSKDNPLYNLYKEWADSPVKFDGNSDRYKAYTQ